MSNTVSDVVDYTDFTTIDTPAKERAKLDVGDIYMNVAKHEPCGWIIRSRNRHDYRSCKCGGVSINGGSWYHKLVGDIDHTTSHIVYYKKKHRV